MIKLGLCSITFRDLSVSEIIKLVKEAKLDAIEWGSDVHVIPTDIENAKNVRKLMDENNLETSSYGSYYRVGIENDFVFEDIVEVAKILGAKDIRVWAGRLGSADVNQTYFDNVVADSRRIADLAAKYNIRISYEYHSRTLTDTPESALRLLEAVNHDNVKLYWQPTVDETVENRILEIKKVKDYITNVHVFSWIGIDREALSNQSSAWKQYISTIEKLNNNNRYYILEFVKDDSIENFKADAKALRAFFE